MAKGAMDELPIRYYSEITARKVDWLWYPYIPFGKITVIQGDPGDGKTTLLLHIAALLSTGRPMPEEAENRDCMNIIYQSAEDGAEDTLKPRMVCSGADCSRISFIDDVESPISLSDSRIEAVIHQTGARLLVLDPLQAYLGDNNELNRAGGVRPVLKRLAAVAERTNCAIVLIGHMNKASGSKGIYRGLGSIDITAIARSVLLVGRLRDDPSVRVMAHLKSSLAKEGASIAFEIEEDTGLRWLGERDVTASELLGGDGDSGDSGKLSSAVSVLRGMLSDGACPCVEIYTALYDMDISKRSVDRAKRMLGVKSTKHADGWHWSL